MAGTWLDQSDLQNVLSVATFSAIFADATSGLVDLEIVASVISRAEQEVLSWLVDEYGATIQSEPNLGADLFLKGCALEYAVAFAYDRFPEYQRANGKDQVDRFARAEARMERVLQSRQRPTSLPKAPANVGGVLVNSQARIIADGADGANGGDY